jgi:hypothetical protein
VRFQVTVVVSAIGVQGVTAPATGTGASPAALAIAVSGAVLTAAALAAAPLRRRFTKKA